MTYRTISGDNPTGVTVSASYTGALVEKTATIEGNGLDMLGYGRVENYGLIHAASGDAGVHLSLGGYVFNATGASVGGSVGVKSLAGGSAGGTVNNFGDIAGSTYGVELLKGGRVTNLGEITGTSGLGFGDKIGVLSQNGALVLYNYGGIFGQRAVNLTTGTIKNGAAGEIQGNINILGGVVASGAATLHNYAYITDGVTFAGGGLITNARSGTLAVDGVAVAGGAVLNGGLISSGSVAVSLSGGSSLTNGYDNASSALIEGRGGVSASGASSITNLGTIDDFAGSGTSGIYLSGGSRAVNGSLIDTAALIEGYAGANLAAGTTLSNYGSVVGSGHSVYGVSLQGATLINGADTDTLALIEGYGGVSGGTKAATIGNFGTIAAVGLHGQAAALLFAGGGVVNGDISDRAAEIRGQVGVSMGGVAAVTNYGTIDGSAGQSLRLLSGGSVRNGSASDQTALVEGKYSLYSNGAALALSNYGTIISAEGQYGAVFEKGGGSVVNGSAGDQSAEIEGPLGVQLGAAGTLTNFGAILATSGAGVQGAGGRVVNGNGVDPKALIRGLSGIDETALATITNVGVIDGAAGYSIRLLAGGSVVNGTATNASALIEGQYGVNAYGAISSVTNFGTVRAVGGSAGAVYSQLGGVVTNGSSGDPNALIEGVLGVELVGAYGSVSNFGAIIGASGIGVEIAGAGTVKNIGTVDGGGGYGVVLGGGSVANGRFTDQYALIRGYGGVELTAGTATLSNFGTVLATNTGAYAVNFSSGGVLYNGARGDPTALLQSEGGGARLSGAGGSFNFGTIAGGTGSGVVLANGATITNGSANRSGAMIEGYEGVTGSGTVTVVNYGTIAGTGAGAVNFGSASDTLVVGAGSTFVGLVKGGGGLLDLASGVGTVSTLGGFVVSGSMSTTTFSSFNTLEIGAGANFALTGLLGKPSIGAGQTLIVNGGASAAAALTVGGVVSVAGLLTAASISNTGTIGVIGGTLIVTGAVTGAGAATINGGTLDFAGAFKENVTFTGTTGVLELGNSQGYTGTITGFSTIGGASLDLVDIGFVSSSEATFSGTTRSGVLTVTDGSHTAKINLKGNYVGSSFVASSDGHGGVTIVDPKAPSASPLALIAAMASLGSAAPAPSTPHETFRQGPIILAAPHAVIA